MTNRSTRSRLPGGYVFINRGAIEAADNESQLAGVMAHELVSRGTASRDEQATKAQYAQWGAEYSGWLGAFSAERPERLRPGAGQLRWVWERVVAVFARRRKRRRT